MFVGSDRITMTNQPNNPEPNPLENQPTKPVQTAPGQTPAQKPGDETRKQNGVIEMAPSLKKTSYAEGEAGTEQFQQLERHTVVPEEADRMTRLYARLIDGLIIGVPYLVAIMAGSGALVFLCFAAVLALAVYQIYLLHTEGQTIGKRTMNIRIVEFDGGENGGFVRNFLLREFVNGLLAFIPFYAIVDILFIFRDDQRCIHDHIAGTKVVKA